MPLLQKNNALALVCGASLLLAGCADYMNNRDSVTLGVGNANYANQGVHTINPFPPVAKNTNIDIGPETTGNAVGRYVTPGDPSIAAE
jgi:hypothetical protein